MRSLSAQSRILDRPADWFLEEVSHSIKGRAVGSLAEYLTLDRTGRATALADSGRRVVWQVYERYSELLGDRFEWDDLPLLCMAEIQRSPERLESRHVIVDEGQDLSPAALRLCLALAGDSEPSVLLLADAAQSIYRRGFRWKDVGVTVRGRQVLQLTDNYRNTLEILRASNGFLERHPSLRDDGEEAPLDENTPRRGPKPTIVSCGSEDGEAISIARRIRWLRRHKGVPHGNVAVLARRRRRLEVIAETLQTAGVPCVLHTDDAFALGTDCVKLVTLHSAKGLEFPIVFHTDVNDGVLPRHANHADEDGAIEAAETARRLLYVGMTRAMQELYITTTASRRSPLLSEIPEEWVEAVTSH